MKIIEEEFKSIKSDYGDKISSHTRNKLEKYLGVVREMSKHMIIKPGQQKLTEEKTVQSVKAELNRLRMQIEGQIKLQMTDYQAFLWKLSKITHKEKPSIFNNLRIPQQPQQDPQLQQIKKNINSPLLSMRTKDLIKIATQLLITENKYCAQNYSVQQIAKLITQISFNYNILPYHHFTHAFSVFLMFMQCKFVSDGIAKMFNDFQFFVGAVAGLCHDMGHMGTNNSYEAKKNSRIAIIYNYQSILENMHISNFYRLCRQNPDVDIISKMKSPLHRQNAKRLFSRLILSTDVQGHTKNLKKLQLLAKKQLSQFQASQKQILLQNLFHGCDVGNPCLNFDNYINWSLLISEQFNNQVEKERVQQLEVTQNVEFVNLSAHFQRQIGFIDFIVLPLWTQISNCLPELQVFVKQIHANKKKLIESKQIQQKK